MKNNCDNYIEAGKITSPHSFKGEVKIQVWCDSAEFLAQFENLYLDADGGECLKVNRMRIHKNTVIASFAGIENEAGALSLRNKVVYIDRGEAALEEGVFFIADLIGLPVFDFDSGIKYGVLADVFSNGANDIYVIDCGGKREAMIPNVPEFIKKVSLEEGVFVAPIEGMF
jgi:16S rRNA processing protein RimM